MKRCIAVLAVGLVGVVALPASAGEGTWSLEVTPYLWAAGIDADVTVGDKSGNIDVGFDDLKDYLDYGGGLLLIADKNDWVVWVQGDAIGLDSDEDTSKFDEFGTLELDMFILEAAIGRKFNNPLSEKGKIDALVGARYTSLEMSFDPKAEGRPARDASTDLVDPMFVLRPWFPITEKLAFNPTLAIGGGGDSDLIYELQPQLQYNFTKDVALRVGYRKLYYKVEGNRNSEFDGSLEGAIIGLGMTL